MDFCCLEGGGDFLWQNNNVAISTSSLNTTVMVKNIPNKYDNEMLTSILVKKGFAKCFNYVYVVPDSRTGLNKGYAFVDFVDNHIARKFITVFQGEQLPSRNSTKVCECVWAVKQGIPVKFLADDSVLIHQHVKSAGQPSPSEQNCGVDCGLVSSCGGFGFPDGPWSAATVGAHKQAMNAGRDIEHGYRNVSPADGGSLITLAHDPPTSKGSTSHTPASFDSDIHTSGYEKQQVCNLAPITQMKKQMDDRNSRKLFVGGLPLAVTSSDLLNHFSSFGSVDEAAVVMCKVTNMSRGFGFCTFAHRDHLKNALEASGGHYIGGRCVGVRKYDYVGSLDVATSAGSGSGLHHVGRRNPAPGPPRPPFGNPNKFFSNSAPTNRLAPADAFPFTSDCPFSTNASPTSLSVGGFGSLNYSSPQQCVYSRKSHTLETCDSPLNHLQAPLSVVHVEADINSLTHASRHSCGQSLVGSTAHSLASNFCVTPTPMMPMSPGAPSWTGNHSVPNNNLMPPGVKHESETSNTLTADLVQYLTEQLEDNKAIPPDVRETTSSLEPQDQQIQYSSKEGVRELMDLLLDGKAPGVLTDVAQENLQNSIDWLSHQLGPSDAVAPESRIPSSQPSSKHESKQQVTSTKGDEYNSEVVSTPRGSLIPITSNFPQWVFTTPETAPQTPTTVPMVLW